MPKDQFFASQCEGKEKLSAATARMVARKGKDPTLEAYKCPHCRKWHVGSNPKKMKKGWKR